MFTGGLAPLSSMMSGLNTLQEGFTDSRSESVAKNESELEVQNQNTSFTSLALRLNISKRLHDF